MSGQYLSLELAGSGMVLAEALLDAHGGLLLPEGSVLSDASLAALRRRGVAGCSVVADQPENEADAAEALAARAALRARQLERLTHLFRHCGADPAAAALLALLQHYRQQDEA